MDMDEVGLLPVRSKSKRDRSSNSSKRERVTKISPSVSNSNPNSTARTSARPGLVSRSSAPLLPSLKDASHLPFEGNSDRYGHRDSVTSIKDDPFFRNYQTPHSVSL